MEILLGDKRALTLDYLPLYRNVMKECGSASQTFAALCRIIRAPRTSTFAAKKIIAAKARLPIDTVSDHLDLLGSGKWLKKSAPRGRRTATYSFSGGTDERRGRTYGVLPVWFCQPGASWSQRASFAVICSHWLLTQTECGADAGETVTLREIANRTGLHMTAVRQAIKELEAKGLVCTMDQPDQGSGMGPKLIWLNTERKMGDYPLSDFTSFEVSESTYPTPVKEELADPCDANYPMSDFTSIGEETGQLEHSNEEHARNASKIHLDPVSEFTGTGIEIHPGGVSEITRRCMENDLIEKDLCENTLNQNLGTGLKTRKKTVETDADPKAIAASPQAPPSRKHQTDDEAAERKADQLRKLAALASGSVANR